MSTDYAPRGEEKTVGCAHFYEALPAASDEAATAAAATRAIIMFPDIFGWHSGRHCAIADMLADAGFRVVSMRILDSPPLQGGTDGDGLPPDFVVSERFAEVPPWLKKMPWDSLIKMRVEEALNHLMANGATSICAVGFCWGGLPATHTAVDFRESHCIKAIVIAHPSNHLDQVVYGVDPASVAAEAKVPALLLVAGNDKKELYGADGTVYKAFKEGNADSNTVEFPEMVHGWTTRGDTSDEKVARDASEAYRLMSEFFMRHAK